MRRPGEDMRAGTLTREVVWTSPAGHTIKVKSVRLVGAYVEYAKGGR